MKTIHLVTPTETHEAECLSFLDACKISTSEIAGTAGLERMPYLDWLKKIAQSEAGLDLPTDRVPATTRLGYYGNELIGIINIRHTLNPFLEHAGGHIGYMVHPKKRRLGMATAMLAAGLKLAKETLNLNCVLVTCSPENIGSKKTILNNGGVYENTVHDTQLGPVERYWIDLKGRF